MRVLRLLVLAALIAAGTSAFAQQGPPPGAPGGDEWNRDGSSAGPDAQKREEIRKKIDTVRMWRLTEALKLDEKTGTKLASFLSTIEEKRRLLMSEHMQAMKDLRTALAAVNPDAKTLKNHLDKLEKNRKEMVELQRKEMNGVRDILTVEQQARYVVFQQDFRREMRGMSSGARGNGQGKRGFGKRSGGPGPRGGAREGETDQ